MLRYLPPVETPDGGLVNPTQRQTDKRPPGVGVTDGDYPQTGPHYTTTQKHILYYVTLPLSAGFVRWKLVRKLMSSRKF